MAKQFQAKIDAAKQRNLNKEEFGNKLFNRMWQNQSNFTMKSINNSGLTKDEIKKSWLATGGFLGFKEMMKDELIVKMILGGSKFDTGYKNVGLKKAVGAFKTVVDSIFRTKSEGNKGNVPRKTLVKASLFKKNNGKEIASISLTKKK